MTAKYLHNREQREITVVLMVNRIELVLFHEPQVVMIAVVVPAAAAVPAAVAAVVASAAVASATVAVRPSRAASAA